MISASTTHLPSNHMLRNIDRHLDLDDLRQALKPFYSSTGRPSIGPELMIRMLIVGYCMGICTRSGLANSRSDKEFARKPPVRFRPHSCRWEPVLRRIVG